MNFCNCYDFDFIDHSFKFTKKSKKYYSENQGKNLKKVFFGLSLQQENEDEIIYPTCRRCKIYSKNVEYKNNPFCLRCSDIKNGIIHICKKV